MYNTVKRICTCLIILGLLALFFFPSHYLGRFSQEALAAIDAAAEAAEAGDAAALQREAARLQQHTERAAVALRLFLSHDAVDEMALAMRLIDPAADAQTLRGTLRTARAAVEHLRSIEMFQWDALL